MKEWIVTTITGSKKSIKERITLIAKKPKMAIYTLVAVLLATAFAVGCTITGAANNKEARIIPLTDEEVLQYNQIFEPISFDEEGNAIVNIYNHFFTSYYDKPEDIDLSNFLRYFPSEEGVTDETEFEMLKAAEKWPFGADMTIERMPVPIHKFPAETVNNVLQKYMDITLDDLSGVATETLIYLKEYNAYYNFTSDFAAGIFYCTHGETQGDIVRLFNKSVMLTLKKRGDDYLFISHQRVEGETEATSAADDLNVTIGIELKGNIPNVDLDYAIEFVRQQIDYYNNAGNNLPSSMGTFAIIEAKITGFKRINTGTTSLTTDIRMWLLEYRLRPDNPGNVVLAGGMKMEDIDGESWITEWGSTGQPYLVVAHNIEEDTWQRICVTNTDEIMTDYGTPEMLERYGNKYTAACMELYRRAAESTDRVFIPNNRYWELIGNADVNGDDRIESIYLDKSKMEAPNSIITLNICDYNEKVIWNEHFSTSHAGWGQLFLCDLENKQYLLRYNPTMYQGYCTYIFVLFSLENGKEKVIRTKTLEFDINGTRELDIPKMLAFADEINSLLDKSTLLISSNGGNFHFATSATSLFYERYSWLDENQELYNDNDSLEERLKKYSKYAVSNRELSEMIFVYKNAVEAYGWFELTTLPTSGLLREYNGNSYAKVNDDNFKTLADLENYLHMLFTDSIVNDLLHPKNGTERYCNIDGDLYAIPADRGTNITKGEEKYEIISSNADTITFRVTVEILGEWDGNKQPITGYETHDFTYEKIGDKWVFTTFNLVR